MRRISPPGWTFAGQRSRDRQGAVGLVPPRCQPLPDGRGSAGVLGPAVAAKLALLVLCLLVGAISARAADLARLFAWQAEIVPLEAGGDGTLLRLVLPPEVIAKSRADLSDVRVFDSAGREVAFVVDSGLRSGEVREARETVEAEVLDVRREQHTPEHQPALFREQYDVALPPPPPGARWELLFDSPRAEFVRAVALADVAADGVARPRAEATIYRLRESEVARTAVVVPEVDGPRLRVTLEGADGAFLEPRLRLRATTLFDRGERAVLPLEILSRRRENGTTIVEVARPDGVVPDVIRLESSTPTYYRAVTVEDVRQGETGQVLARATVFRVRLGKEVAQSEVRLAPARGDRLRLEIADGDSPALEDLLVTAEVRQPVLYFDLPDTGVLRFGGGRVERARYDLEQLSPSQSVARGEVARLAAALLDRGRSRPAALRALRPNPEFDETPLLAFAMQPGAVVDAGDYSHRRPLHVGASPDGLVRLRLEPEDLARARADLADLRVTDGEGRQRPYLLHRAAALASVELAVGAVASKGGVSTYPLALPQAPLRVESIELAVEQPFFSRPYRVVGVERGGAEREVAAGKLARLGAAAGTTTIAVHAAALERLELRVDDGDEAPLAIRAARALVQVPDLYLIAPRGDYFLLLGDPQASAPRYDLADARDAVLSVASVPARAGALEENPARGWRHRWLGGAGDAALQQAAVWIVLALAVAVLGVVTLRLVRRG